MFLIKSADQAHRTALVRADAAVPRRFTGGPAVLAVLLLAGAAAAQEPSPAQRDAIKANCRSDFMSHCASVSPGGKDAFLCLQQNMAKLSSGCKQAVGAVAAAAEPKPALANTPAAAATAAPAGSSSPANSGAPTPAANAAPSGPVAAPSAATTPAASVKPIASPPAPAPAPPAAAAKQGTKPSPSATPVAAPPAPPSSPAPAVAAPAAAPPLIPLREELFIVRNACADEARRLCSDVQPGGGRIIACLRSNGASLSPRCQGALMAGR